MRSLQGLMFFGLALFSVKWEFRMLDIGMGNLPPLKDYMVFWQAGALAAIGLYLLVTGEIASWRKQARRYGVQTFLAAAAFFLAVLTLKFAYYVDPWWVRGGRMRYYPPFDEESIGLPYTLLALLGLYFLVRGEVAFWRWRPEREPTIGSDQQDGNAAAPRPGGKADVGCGRQPTDPGGLV